MAKKSQPADWEAAISGIKVSFRLGCVAPRWAERRFRNSSLAPPSNASRQWPRWLIRRRRGSQLRQGNRHIPAMPVDQHEHVAGAGIFRSQALDFHRFALAERRNRLGHDALGLEGEADFVLQVVIPAQGLLFRSIRVHDRFVLDSAPRGWGPFCVSPSSLPLLRR